MNTNTKIAVGCGGGGCLILIIVALVGVILVAGGYISMPGGNSNNRNSNTRNSNSNNSNSVSNNTNSSSSNSSVLTDDEHKLLQAAAIAQDTELMRRVMIKLGLLNESGGTTDKYENMMKEHLAWMKENGDFVRSVNTKEKARAYVDEHIDD